MGESTPIDLSVHFADFGGLEEGPCPASPRQLSDLDLLPISGVSRSCSTITEVAASRRAGRRGEVVADSIFPRYDRPPATDITPLHSLLLSTTGRLFYSFHISGGGRDICEELCARRSEFPLPYLVLIPSGKRSEYF